MPMMKPAVELEIDDRAVRISNPDRVYFPTRGESKLDLANYDLSVRDGIVRALRERPCMLHRFPIVVTGEKVHQKRVPAGAPPWLETVRVEFPRYGRHAYELCVTEIASGNGLHIYVRIEPRWGFADVRRAGGPPGTGRRSRAMIPRDQSSVDQIRASGCSAQ